MVIDSISIVFRGQNTGYHQSVIVCDRLQYTIEKVQNSVVEYNKVQEVWRILIITNIGILYQKAALKIKLLCFIGFACSF